MDKTISPLLQPSEIKIDTWTILYIPPGGQIYNGKLTITNERLLYNAKQVKSSNDLMPERLLAKWGIEGCLEINKADITAVDVEKSFLAKKAILTLSDGSIHTFNYGVLNIDKVVEAIKSR
ncbi:MAG TPA: hypothetical protein VK498_03550 [Ferruginibacter sp.]|nr:hypothetical protein [Ferruginibacter sp.]